MDPTGHAGGSLISLGASRVTLPLGGSNDIFGSVAAGPGPSGPSTTDSIDAGKMDVHRIEVFSDLGDLLVLGGHDPSSGALISVYYHPVEFMIISAKVLYIRRIDCRL